MTLDRIKHVEHFEMRAIKNRIIFVDYFKGILIVLIVLAHINYANQAIKPWIHSFAAQALFFSPGFMLNKNAPSSGRDLVDKIEKKFRRLMVPYYLWAAIYALFSVPNFLYIIYASYNSIDRGGSLTPLWFLPVLFTSTVLYLAFQYLLKDRFTIPVKLAMILICFVTGAIFPKIELGYPMGINVSFVAFGFILLGNICFPPLMKCEAYIVRKGRLIGGMISGAVTLIFGAGSVVLCRMNSPYVKAALMADARYGHFGLFLLGGFAGIVCICAAVLFFESISIKPIDWILSYLGQNTFAIYVIHKPVVVLMKTVFRSIAIPSWLALSIACVVAVTVSCIGNILINRYAPVLIGKSI